MDIGARQPDMVDQFGKGGLHEPDDNRDKIFKGTGRFDWQKGTDIEAKLTTEVGSQTSLIVEHQGKSLSCVGQAGSKYLEVLNIMETGNYVDMSAHDLYAYIAIRYGGAYIRDLMKRIVNVGCMTEALVPSYESSGAPSEDFMRAKPELSKVKQRIRGVYAAKQYSKINDRFDMDTFAEAIDKNNGCIIGVNGANNGTWYSLFPQPPSPGEVIWGHVMYAGKARILNSKRYIGVLQSWGINAGDKGWQWIGEEYFKSGNVYDPWTLEDKPNAPVGELINEKIYDTFKLMSMSPTSAWLKTSQWNQVMIKLGLEMNPIVFGRYNWKQAVDYYDWLLFRKWLTNN